jgi:hypothetical protein
MPSTSAIDVDGVHILSIAGDLVMNLKLFKFGAAVVIAAFSLSAHAECSYPKAPDSIPNGATASEQEMVAAMQAFKSYDAEVAAFGTCLEQETKEKSSGTGQLMQLKTMQMKKHNAAVAELQAKAKEFNEQVRIFKSKG